MKFESTLALTLKDAQSGAPALPPSLDTGNTNLLPLSIVLSASNCEIFTLPVDVLIILF